MLVLQRDNFLCIDHLKQNRIVPADMVHHIKELKDHPELALEPSNLVSLCFSCHEKYHDRSKSKKKRQKPKNTIVFSANEELD